MAVATVDSAHYAEQPLRLSPAEANSSGVSWSAVVAGAFATAALSLILLSLGTGLGFSSISPWAGQGASASTVGKSAIVWFILIEILSSSLGGYLAGRLRTKWASIHTDEVYFRDTAHGFLAWATASVVTVAFLSSAAAMMVGSTPQKDSSTKASDPNTYYVDTLFRGDGKSEVSPDVRAESGTIFARALQQGSLSANDRSYLGQVIAAKTGLSQGDAESRATQTYEDAQQAAETIRKTAAHLLLWTFVALLAGAFFASLSATFGGRQRDHVITV